MREAGRRSGYMPLSGTASGRPLMINSVSRRGHRQILLATFSSPKTAFPQLKSPFQATRRRNLRLAALGSALRRSGRPGEAREPLRQALDLATACGAGGLAQHARAELYAAGARSRTEALHGVESLTPSERRVAGMAADGT